MMRKVSEIKAKIKEFEKERKSLSSHSMFGDDNWGTLDKQLEILNLCLKDSNFDPQAELDKMIDYYDGNFPEDNEIEKSKMEVLDWILEKTDEC